MKYKVGDKVKIREDLDWDKSYHTKFQKLDPPYVATIIRASFKSSAGSKRKNRYVIDTYPHLPFWFEYEIEDLYKEPVPIYNRFELLDL